MNLLEFSEKMKKAVQDYYGENVVVMLNEVTKNNGVVLQGMSIMEKEKNISPTIYLNCFYESYEEGMTFADCVKKMICVYEENKTQNNINMDFFTNYEEVKGKIVYKLINYKKNEKLLEEVPYIPYLDLAIVFYCLVCNEVIGNATVLIRNSHMKMWNIHVDELYEQANLNSPRLLPYEIRNMEDVMRTILRENMRREYLSNDRTDDTETQEWIELMVEQMLEEAMGDGKVPMYVLSNQTRILGAACILYQNVMQELTREIQKDLYVLPSSVHELILVPVQEYGEQTNLNEMVQEVNETQVDAEEVLSNHAYYYSRVSGKLSVV